MARLKFGSIIVDGSGSLGGHTIQNSLGGSQLRNKPINKKAPTQAQQIIRGYNKTLQGGWRNLSDVQRKYWHMYATSHNITNKNGEKHSLSGHALWMKYNYKYIAVGLPFQPDVYKAAIGPFGDELIKNGTFANSDYWTVQPTWTIAGGKAIYFPISTGYIAQDVVMLSGMPVRIKFTITGVSGVGRLAFTSQLGLVCFSAPLNGYLNVINGSYVFDCNLLLDITKLRVYGNTAGVVFQLDDLSIKEII